MGVKISPHGRFANMSIIETILRDMEQHSDQILKSTI
jgi:hypothetical protein